MANKRLFLGGKITEMTIYDNMSPPELEHELRITNAEVDEAQEEFRNALNKLEIIQAHRGRIAELLGETAIPIGRHLTLIQGGSDG